MRDGTVTADHVWKRFRADQRRNLVRNPRELLRHSARAHRWVLRDVNLRVEPGEAVGLFGFNGSGKSTLLKILSRVMYPHSGSVGIAGRVGALIEVRAGIHPELSGRENVFLYGTLLGLSRSEVLLRFDAIVDFAQLADSIDRQVKFYSSGMQMRLGFAVAAFLEPDVLLVDEVLAVGDATFQQRCLERMREVFDNGTTLVFVSHDLAAIEAMCDRGIWLHRGAIRAEGPVRDVLATYRSMIEEGAHNPERHGPVRISCLSLVSEGGGPPQSQKPLEILVEIEADEAVAGQLCLGISEGTASPIVLVRTAVEVGATSRRVACRLPFLPLGAGTYSLWGGLFVAGQPDPFPWQPLQHFEIVGRRLVDAPRGILRLSPVHVQPEWVLDPSVEEPTW